jgi:hypothetical protein
MHQHLPRTLRIGVLLALLAWRLVPAGAAPGSALRVREALRRDLPNAADYRRMERGYYEALLDSGRQLGALADGRSTAEKPVRPPGAPIDTMPFVMPVDDLREFVLKPNLVIDLWGVRVSTNALGMHDRPYAMRKPPHTFRVALVGDSIAAGWGLAEGQGFEPRLERSLDERSRGAGGPAVEILNFAIPGSAPGQRWENFTRVGWALGPDLVLFESTRADDGWDAQRLRGLLARGLAWDSPLYRDALAAAGLRPGWDMASYERGLRPFSRSVLAGVYRRVAADCRARGVPCFWVLFPRVGDPTDPAGRARLTALARGAGFTRVVDLSDAYEGDDPADLAVGPNDFHPNAEGHARLARRLGAVLSDQPELSWLAAPRADSGHGGDPR